MSFALGLTRVSNRWPLCQPRANSTRSQGFLFLFDFLILFLVFFKILFRIFKKKGEKKEKKKERKKKEREKKSSKSRSTSTLFNIKPCIQTSSNSNFPPKWVLYTSNLKFFNLVLHFNHALNDCFNYALIHSFN